MLKKLYIIINKYLSPSYRAVQAGHAVAEYLLKNTDKEPWNNDTLIFLLTMDIILDYKVLEEMDFTLYPFYEPDIDNQMTAFACYSDNKVFNRFEMN